MQRFLIGLMILVFPLTTVAQTVAQKLERSFQQFEADPQLKHSVNSLYVVDLATGEVVFDRRSRMGLVPGSTLKVITAATGFEILGPDFRYDTRLEYQGNLKDGVLSGNIVIRPSGDPTLGSERFATTGGAILRERWCQALINLGIKKVEGEIIIAGTQFELQQFPDGWIWQDIGNYFGAGHYALNWRENQYDVFLQSGSTLGSSVKILPSGYAQKLRSEVKAAAAGSGDNAYVYLPIGNDSGVVRGTIPVNQGKFRISAADYQPPLHFASELKNWLEEAGVTFKSAALQDLDILKRPILNHQSPPLDSMTYWFLQKSINLYGEAILKTIGLQTGGIGATRAGIAALQKFWKGKGVDERELNIGDGSGLSPQNRITTHAQVEILRYARGRPWYSSFYQALPEFNGIKMKSGTINGVKGFCGYHRSVNGREYVFSFLVNNFSGTSSQLTGKMYKVLDVLK
jgi:serine-type D-Ala-D-Ala carboxypeptidase/endopeptidase (penicillin-binding protein 4)